MTWADSLLGTMVLLGAGAALGLVLGLVVRLMNWAVNRWEEER